MADSVMPAEHLTPMRSNAPRRDPLGRDRRRGRSHAELEEPILAELFSVERLEQHAQTLAAAQAITDTPRRGRAVQPRVAENGRVLLESYRVLARAIKDERSITPAAEWLVDNFHIVDEQLREIRDDLPAGLLPRAPQARRRPSRRATRGSSASPGPTSPTPTAASTPRACGAWCAPTRRSSR